MSDLKNLITEVANCTFNKNELILSDQRLDDSQILLLCDALRRNPYVKNLDLSYNQLSGKGLKALMSLETLESLNVSNNNITCNAKHDVCQGKLKKLDISGNPIGDGGISFFSENSTITELTARSCEITGPGLTVLFENNVHLEKLNVSYNQIVDEGLCALPQNKTLIELSLSANRITRAAAEYIYGNHSLRVLELSENSLGSGAAIILKHRTLEKLDLSQNGINDEGLIGLPNNKKLRRLILSDNKITSKGGKELAEFEALDFLNLSWNKLDDNCIDWILSLRNLREIWLHHNPITDEGFAAINEALQRRERTEGKSLLLRYNSIEVKRKLDPDDKAESDQQPSKVLRQ